MKERCSICGRKMKEGSDRCKVCKSEPDEKLAMGIHAVHNVNFMINPYVNLILTDRRLLVFEDIANNGLQQGAVGRSRGAMGGLIGSAVGSAADAIIGKTLGNNGSLKQNIPLSSIETVESEQKTKGIQITVNLPNGKSQKFTLGNPYTDESATAEGFLEMLRSSAGA